MIKKDYKASGKRFLKITIVVLLVLIIALLISFIIFSSIRTAPNEENTGSVLEICRGSAFQSSDLEYRLFFLSDKQSVLLWAIDSVEYLDLEWQSENIFACSDKNGETYIFMLQNKDTISCNRFNAFLYRYVNEK